MQQNIRSPQRTFRPYHYRITRSQQIRNFLWSIPSRLSNTVLPLDLSSTLSRFLFRIPSIYLLGKAIVLWGVLFLQGAEVYPASAEPLSWDKWEWVGRLGEWAIRKPVDEVAWSTFTSVCTAVFVGALTSGIEGVNTQSNPQFNLVRILSLSRDPRILLSLNMAPVRILFRTLFVFFANYARGE